MSDALIVVQQYSEEAQEVLDHFQGLQVTDQDSFQQASELARDLKTQINQIEAERKKIAGPQYEAWKATNDLFNRIKEKYVLAEEVLKAKLQVFLQAEHERELALLREASEGDTTAMVLAAEAAPVAQGISERKKVSFVIKDAKLIPREYLIPDEKKIRAAVNAGIEVPGVKVTKTLSVSVRGR